MLAELPRVVQLHLGRVGYIGMAGYGICGGGSVLEAAWPTMMKQRRVLYEGVFNVYEYVCRVAGLCARYPDEATLFLEGNPGDPDI